MLNARLRDDDLYSAASNWHQIQHDVESLGKVTAGEEAKIRQGLQGRMYRAGVDIPMLIAEIMRLRQYVPKDKRYP